MKFGGKCMGEEIIILNDVAQVQKDKYHVLFPIYKT